MNAYFDALRRYFDFRGRSTRRQFWLFTLVLLILVGLGAVAEELMGITPVREDEFGVVTGLILLLHIIPIVSVTVRRLHDIDRTGWWVLINVVPILGFIVTMVFACSPSTPGPNRFGPHPKGQGESVGGVQPTATPQPAAALANAPLEQLEKLASLKAAGAIDDDEFQRMKADILNREAAR